MNTTPVYENYFKKYTALVPEKDINPAFENQNAAMKKLFKKISEEKSNYKYAKGKWTLKELMQHAIDTERVFAYRALAIARKEKAILPSFDENLYAKNADANKRTWAALTTEMKMVRQTTKLMFASFSKKMLDTSGFFSSMSADVKTLGLIIVGHFYHHINIIEERYFN